MSVASLPRPITSYPFYGWELVGAAAELRTVLDPCEVYTVDQVKAIAIEYLYDETTVRNLHRMVVFWESADYTKVQAGCSCGYGPGRGATFVSQGESPWVAARSWHNRHVMACRRLALPRYTDLWEPFLGRLASLRMR